VPAVALLGWTGLWDDLPAAHFTSVLFDALCALGLLFAGRRLAGWRLGVSLAFALRFRSPDLRTARCHRAGR